ncbi:hypothetical protein LJR219_002332 [Phenylobacterium sp. LjRoot219]|uniref:hypothetical protein n=1 Tax=Phenylobacterium sp. LjRoot219 TaxID=3342283 RepID=UPI003ED04BEE
MSASFDRFLNARHRQSRKASLGRAFTVSRQSWRLSEDPRETEPEVEIVATRRTASEAADLAREAAWSFKRNGFHKPSGAWWGADGESFHRFMVRPSSRATTGAALLAVALAGVAAVAISQRKSGRGK